MGTNEYSRSDTQKPVIVRLRAVGFSKMKFVMSVVLRSAHCLLVLEQHTSTHMARTSPRTGSFYEHRHIQEKSKKNAHTLAGHVKLLAPQLLEDFQELLHETNDLCRDLVLVLRKKLSVPCGLLVVSKGTYSDIRLALREPSADWLLDEQDARQVGPAEFILGRVCLAVGPLEWLHEDNINLCTSQDGTGRKLTPFSCRRPSSEEQPGPPFVLHHMRQYRSH